MSSKPRHGAGKEKRVSGTPGRSSLHRKTDKSISSLWMHKRQLHDKPNRNTANCNIAAPMKKGMVKTRKPVKKELEAHTKLNYQDGVKVKPSMKTDETYTNLKDGSRRSSRVTKKPERFSPQSTAFITIDDFMEKQNGHSELNLKICYPDGPEILDGSLSLDPKSNQDHIAIDKSDYGSLKEDVSSAENKNDFYEVFQEPIKMSSSKVKRKYEQSPDDEQPNAAPKSGSLIDGEQNGSSTDSPKGTSIQDINLKKRSKVEETDPVDEILEQGSIAQEGIKQKKSWCTIA